MKTSASLKGNIFGDMERASKVSTLTPNHLKDERSS